MEEARMSGTTTKEADARADKQPELSPEQVREINLILVRARQGDESVLPELQRVLDENPEIWVRAGNIAAHAQAAWLRLISGPARPRSGKWSVETRHQWSVYWRSG
jgi:hypothetical protein